MQHTESVDSPVKVLLLCCWDEYYGVDAVHWLCVCETTVAWNGAGEKLSGYGLVMVCGQAWLAQSKFASCFTILPIVAWFWLSPSTLNSHVSLAGEFLTLEIAVISVFWHKHVRWTVPGLLYKFLTRNKLFIRPMQDTYISQNCGRIRTCKHNWCCSCNFIAFKKLLFFLVRMDSLDYFTVLDSSFPFILLR